jgi:hypothetical protein
MANESHARSAYLVRVAEGWAGTMAEPRCVRNMTERSSRERRSTTPLAKPSRRYAQTVRTRPIPCDSALAPHFVLHQRQHAFPCGACR